MDESDGNDVIDLIKGSIGQHAAIGVSCHMYAVHIKTIVVPHVVHNCPYEGNLIVATPEVTGILVLVLACCFCTIVDFTSVKAIYTVSTR